MTMGPQPGQLRHRVNVLRNTETGDGRGGSSSAWANVATVWAEVAPMQGRELFAAQQVNALTSHKITMRYFAGLTAADRIQFGSRSFNIRQVINVEEVNRWHELIAEEFSE
jgi:SPP1 family predicted phage head-tail adaptor